MFCLHKYEEAVLKIIYLYPKNNMKPFFFLFFIPFLWVNCSIKKKQPSEPTITINGTFESKQGVMTPLSCYCFNGGFLTTSDDKHIPVCFENNNNIINCQALSVTGFYKTVKNNPEPTSPCPKGEMTYFRVIRFKCL